MPIIPAQTAYLLMVLILATFPFILQWLLVELVWRPIVQDSTVSSETQTSVTDHN